MMLEKMVGLMRIRHKLSSFAHGQPSHLPLHSAGLHWGLCALRHGIQISMEAILACHPARSTE